MRDLGSLSAGHPSGWAVHPDRRGDGWAGRVRRQPRIGESSEGHKPTRRLIAVGGTATRGVVGTHGTSVDHVRCPACSGLDDKVVDSRLADDGSAIRRRRECLACGHRFTTFERMEEAPLVVVKRSGDKVPFERTKIETGIIAAAKGRPLTADLIAAVATEIEEQFRLLGGEVTSEKIGLAVLERLQDLDPVTYLRFASVYKGFDDPDDFQREVRLLKKTTEPKRHQE
ncbi:MAG: transcriptional regulator NrdR [Acidimicrobiales bacterium]|nr:transcriptional regulator NrdR [Acidimicrobiales bacterium]